MLVLVVATALLVAAPTALAHPVTASGVHYAGPLSRGNNVSSPKLYLGFGANLVNYSSSVDGWKLSYYEWLPTNYTPTRAYPLIVYLHGQQDTSGTWFVGGLASDLMQSYVPSSTGSVAADVRAFVNDSQSMGFILIALNSRSGSGWYINTPCGGPQQQDVLDAINHEKNARLVSALYLFGMSMGTEGTLSIAASHRIFAGIGIIAPVTDMYENVAYRESLSANNVTWATTSLVAKAHLFCGVLPGTGNASQQAVAREFENMSPLRFHPQAFIGVPIFVTAGGADDRAPNNVSFWPYWMNVNNTFVNVTCNTQPALGEPSGCSTSMNNVHLVHPTNSEFYFLYEKSAGHDLSQLDPLAMLDYWLGLTPGGFYLGGYPFSPAPTVNPNLTY